MKTNPQNKNPVAGNSAAIVRVTQKMVQERAEELAVIKGRNAGDITQSDLAQARRELTGEPDPKA